ncbi:MAG: transposase [Myxococcota bacterium]|nr:transposase [Myxococcota bacterium]
MHHVMVRGVERRQIFLDDVDYEAYLGRLSCLVPDLGFRCFAWALMPNHVHLVLQTGPVPLARLMARVGTAYAGRFNRRHDRVGHLFQNRYRARRVIDDRDLLGVILYAHLNPLEGGLVGDLTELAEFAWCGHGALMATRQPWPFESPARVLELFGRTPGVARESMLAQMESRPPKAE